jgi:hypothetical protein
MELQEQPGQQVLQDRWGQQELMELMALMARQAPRELLGPPDRLALPALLAALALQARQGVPGLREQPDRLVLREVQVPMEQQEQLDQRDRQAQWVRLALPVQLDLRE